MSEEFSDEKKTRDGVAHSDILEALTARRQWAERQALYEQMRTDGIRRKVKPWKNAADMHFPLVDTQVEKNKPYYIEQVFGRELVACFTALKKEAAPHATAAAQWFNWFLSQRSNFAEFVELATDKMLMGGRVPCRVYWDATRKRLCFDACDPVKVIVPAWTKKIQEADWICFVMEYSEFGYKRQEYFDQDEDFVKRITGKSGDETRQDEAQERTAGITHTDKGKVIVWELYVQTATGWRVHTYSPAVPDRDVRKPRDLPYDKGIFETEKCPPFAQLSAELRAEGYYSARGLGQRLAPFEASLNADWNAQKDFQQLACNPLFSAPKGLPNNANVKFTPGQILPFELSGVQFPSMPMDLAAQMAQTRATAEQLVGPPDFGLGASGAIVDKKKTATEVNALTSVTGANISMRGRRFRQEINDVLAMAWALCLQYAPNLLDFYFRGELGVLPKEALSDAYFVELQGTGEDSRAIRVQKAFARMQTFANNPSINQRALAQACLEEDDPRLVRELLLDTNTQGADQFEDQAAEISMMLIGFPALVKPADDHAIHLQSLLGFIERRKALGEPISPELGVLLAQHGMQHFQFLQQANPEAAKQMEPAMKDLQVMGEWAGKALQMQQQKRQAAAAQQAQPEQQV